MTAKELIQMAFAACEGMEDAVEGAPDLSAEEIDGWLTEIVEKKRYEQSTAFVCAFVKGLKSGRFSYMDVN